MATFSYIFCICCDILEKNGLVLLIFGTVIRYDVLLMLGSVPNLSNYNNIILKFDVFVVIYQKRMG